MSLNQPVGIIPPPPPSNSTRRLSGGTTVTKSINGVTSIKITTPPNTSPSTGLSTVNSGSISGQYSDTLPPKNNAGSSDQLGNLEFLDDSIDEELVSSIPESGSVLRQLPPRRVLVHHTERRNRIGLTVSASSSPEAGVSPQTLAEQGWKSFDGVDEDKWIEEGRLLIEPDEEDDDADPSVDGQPTRKRHESDEEEDEEEEVVDIWSMSKDQQEYYRKQFQSLLGSNGGSKVSGPVAKDFFVLSKLSSSELANIWQLADIDKDGSLNLVEFSIAMHLVVLRKKASLEVPSLLPKSLVSSALKISPAIMLESGQQGDSVNGCSIKNNQSDSNLIDMSSSPKPGYFINNHNVSNVMEGGKEWTKFTDSPTARKNKSTVNVTNDHPQRSYPLATDSGHMIKNSFQIPSDLSSGDDSSSSKGLANFDFPSSSVETNPSIVHPVALRLTPEVGLLSDSPSVAIPRCSTAKKQQQQLPSGIMPPPLPPPRPAAKSISGHARSSSLDLDKLHSNNRRSTWSSNGGSQFPYVLPSSAAGHVTVPQITSMSPSNLMVGANDDHHGAFSVYKKVKSPLPPPVTVRTDSSKEIIPKQQKEEDAHSRTLKVIQSQFSLEPIPSLIPNNPCDMNELKRCLKLSNDRISQLEEINQILMEKLAETVDKNIDLESKYSKKYITASKLPTSCKGGQMVTVSTATASSINPPNHNSNNNHNNNNSTSSVQCTKI